MKKFDTLLPCAMFFGTIFTLSEFALAQEWSSGVPDSTYVRDEIIIWFLEGMLNPNFPGCELL